MEVAIAEDPRPLRSHLFRRPAQSRDAGGVTAAPGAFGCPDPSRHKVVRFQQPDQFRGPFPSFFHLPGKGLR